MVVGVGGVGSWTVEALARSGVGTLTLVDLDEVCVSNINRQLPALADTLGQAKVEVLAARVKAINPECRVTAIPEFVTEENVARVLAEASPNHVVDAIDSVANKCRLIAACRLRGLPVIVCGGAGGRRDATQVRIVDLARATHDRLLREVRQRLRQEHGFPRGDQEFGIECVFSAESPVFPREDGTVCAAGESLADPGDSRRLNCDWGFGSAAFVTGTFGFVAAGRVVSRLAQGSAPLNQS
jgi:tRNA A37 threonylcarbamoyladenosine dehydratase